MSSANGTRLPPPACPYGYTADQVHAIVGTDLRDTFNQWMSGQTRMLCAGESYDHATRTTGPSACAEEPHGGITYTHDLERFMGRVERAEKRGIAR